MVSKPWVTPRQINIFVYLVFQFAKAFIDGVQFIVNTKIKPVDCKLIEHHGKGITEFVANIKANKMWVEFYCQSIKVFHRMYEYFTRNQWGEGLWIDVSLSAKLIRFPNRTDSGSGAPYRMCVERENRRKFRTGEKKFGKESLRQICMKRALLCVLRGDRL